MFLSNLAIDEVDTKGSYTTPNEFKNNLRKYITDIRSKNAEPILFPVSRRRFDNDANFFDTHGEYAQYVRKIAKETNTELIDMHTISMAILVHYGKKKSTELFLHCSLGSVKTTPMVLKTTLISAIMEHKLWLKRSSMLS